MGPAPRATASLSAPRALVARGLTPNETYTVKMKRVGGDYVDVGQIVPTTSGAGNLPVFEIDRVGTYVFALIDPRGDTSYIKVRVRR